MAIAKWHVVGHDAGPAVAVHAHRFPEHLDHLVLLSPAVFPELKPFSSLPADTVADISALDRNRELGLSAC